MNFCYDSRYSADLRLQGRGEGEGREIGSWNSGLGFVVSLSRRLPRLEGIDGASGLRFRVQGLSFLPPVPKQLARCRFTLVADRPGSMLDVMRNVIEVRTLSKA